MSRSKFVEISEGIFRELGFAPPSMLHEDSLPLVMELEFEGKCFELVHSPNELQDKFLIVCKLGEMPAAERVHGMQEMMKENLLQMRVCGEWFGINAANNEIHSMCHKSLDELSALEILQHMKAMVERSVELRKRIFDIPVMATPKISDYPNPLLA